MFYTLNHSIKLDNIATQVMELNVILHMDLFATLKMDQNVQQLIESIQ
jgi:hypothetical protein